MVSFLLQPAAEFLLKGTYAFMKQTKENAIGLKNWIVILITGLAGQLCWHVENQWFTTYVYAKIAPNPDIISGMVALSAITGSFAVVFFGTLSDRVGRRKPLMAAGYMIWGITVMLFGLTEYARSSLTLAAVLTVAADCVMTFFGSLAYDAGFNPWTSDITNEHNRGMLGAAISVLPVFATIIGSLLFGGIIDAVDYTAFFFLLGGSMVLVGVFTLLFLKDAPGIAPNRDEKGFWHQFFSFFSFKPLQDKLLRWVLIIFMTYFIGFQMYFSHITNYLIYSRGFSTGTSGILLGVGLLLAAPLTFVAGRFINRGHHFTVMNLTVVSSIIGLLTVGLVKGTAATVAAIFFIGAGYMVIFQTLMVMLKNLYPPEIRAQCEGLRSIFYVMIPMCVGTPIGSAIIKASGIATVNEYGITGYAAANNLFLIAAAVMLITFIPIRMAKKAAAEQGK